MSECRVVPSKSSSRKGFGAIKPGNDSKDGWTAMGIRETWKGFLGLCVSYQECVRVAPPLYLIFPGVFLKPGPPHRTCISEGYWYVLELSSGSKLASFANKGEGDE